MTQALVQYSYSAVIEKVLRLLEEYNASTGNSLVVKPEILEVEVFAANYVKECSSNNCLEKGELYLLSGYKMVIKKYTFSKDCRDTPCIEHNPPHTEFYLYFEEITTN